MLSLLWRVNLFVQVCKLPFIKLFCIDLIPIHFTLSPVIFIRIITSITFSSLGKMLINSTDTPARGGGSVKKLHGCIGCRLNFAISLPKYRYDLREKQRGMILFFSIIELFPMLVRFSPLKYLLCVKYTAIIRWPPHKVTTLQAVRTSFLGPRPRLSPSPPPPLPGLAFVFNLSWELQLPQGPPKTMLFVGGGGGAKVT